MSLPSLSIKRPIFIVCVVISMLAVGLLSLGKLPVDLFPNITFPVVVVNTPYPGAGPKEIETLVSRPLEDEMSTLPGIKVLRSINKEGLSTVVAEFSLETDIKFAEQQIRDRVASARGKMPNDIKDPIIRRVDPADQPVMILAVTADLPPGKLFDLADDVLRPKIEQVNKVGLVETLGGRKREIQIQLDRNKLKAHEISATMVAARIAAAGQDVPLGKYDQAGKEVVFRSLGEFKDLKDIENTAVSFLGNDVPVSVNQVGRVVDTLVDEKSRTFVNGKPTILLNVFRQSGSNTIEVVDAVKARIEKLNQEFKAGPGAPKISLVRDGAKPIRANVEDVKETIFLGIILTVLVVFFFLGSGRSTFITGLALPNSLIGAFILMSLCGFSVNVMTLLALSLAVGLLVDDAIVVRENIFRHYHELGKSPVQAAIDGTKEVSLAVLATTLTVIAVFAPIAFLQGVVGQFFKEFGLTICFAMLISLFDAFTMAPMLSAYFAGKRTDGHGSSGDFSGIYGSTFGRLLFFFNKFQDKLEDLYERLLKFTIRRPLMILFSAVGIFFVSMFLTKYVPKTFLPPQDFGEFQVSLDLPPGSSLDSMTEVVNKVQSVLESNKELMTSVAIIGNRDGEANVAQFFVEIVPSKQRNVNTSEFKERVRGQLKPFAYANPVVKDIDSVGGGQRPFNINIIGNDMKELEEYSTKLFAAIRNNPGLKDVEISYRPGKPEFQVALDPRRAERMGVSSILLGQELRTQIEGATPAVFRESGREYDIRVRLQQDQRDLKSGFESTFTPNINQSLIRLTDVAKPISTDGPANITRQDRGRYIQISADIAPDGPGMGGVMAELNTLFTKDMKLPNGMRYAFVGQAENFKELLTNMAVAALLGTLFIFLVLASLYESFVTPLTIMLVLPLAACGAFIALFVTRHSLDIFSMIGCIMLLGIATKNSILLVDYTKQLVDEGMDRAAAIVKAGRTRLRPILMTTIALIAGMLPVAIGLNEASRQRVSMGIAVIGGLISSTLLTLVVVPAAYSYIDRFRLWSSNLLKKFVT